MSKKQSNVLVIKVAKPRNLVASVKMTGSGSHRKSNKSLRLSHKQNLRNLVDNRKGDSFESPYFFI